MLAGPSAAIRKYKRVHPLQLMNTNTESSGNTESGGEYIVQGGEPRGEESRSSVVDERRRASLLGEKSRDPRDASQVPPSVLQKEVGAPQPEDAQEQRSHHGLSLGALGHHGHRALHGKHKGQEETT